MESAERMNQYACPNEAFDPSNVYEAPICNSRPCAMSKDTPGPNKNDGEREMYRKMRINLNMLAFAVCILVATTVILSAVLFHLVSDMQYKAQLASADLEHRFNNRENLMHQKIEKLAKELAQRQDNRTNLTQQNFERLQKDTSHLRSNLTATISQTKFELRQNHLQLETWSGLAISSITKMLGWSSIPKSNLLYARSKEGANWTIAESSCRERGARLAAQTLRSRDILDDMISEGIMSKSERTWVGYRDIDGQGTWVWSDNGTFPSTIRWDSGEPNKYPGVQENCVEIFYKNGSLLLNDRDCSYLRYYICEKDLTMN